MLLLNQGPLTTAGIGTAYWQTIFPSGLFVGPIVVTGDIASTDQSGFQDNFGSITGGDVTVTVTEGNPSFPPGAFDPSTCTYHYTITATEGLYYNIAIGNFQ